MRILLCAAASLLLMAQAPVPQYRTLDDRFPPPRFETRAQWEQRAAYLREHVLASAGLLPLPPRTPLNPVVFGDLAHEDYTVSKVYFESLPGFYVTGNLYRPAGDGPFPAVLSTHGHWAYGRFENSELMSGPGRAISLARRGFVVFTYDMVGYNDSRQLMHTFDGRRERLWGLTLSGLQLWNSIRSLDYLESLPYVRKDKIGVTGESGGGTQAYMLAAADSRIAVAVPVNMVSLQMQGGCLCENPPGLRLDTTNVEIAATIAPRPLLLVSATGDWTKETLEREYPAVRGVYALMGAEDRVKAVRFDAEHNYNQDSREAMYGWMARWLKGEASDAPQKEAAFTPDRLPELLVFHGRTLPAGAATQAALVDGWIASAKQQLSTTPPAGRAAALRHALSFAQEAPAAAVAKPSRGRPTVLVAGNTSSLEPALRRAGYTVKAVRLAPFDEAAAAKVNHFETYNRTPASQRVADIVSALREAPGAILVAEGDAAIAAALAAAVEPPRLAILDVAGFDSGRDEDFLQHLYIPGLRRAGDLRTASEVVPGRVVIHGAGQTFDAPGWRVQKERLGPRDIVELIRK